MRSSAWYPPSPCGLLSLPLLLLFSVLVILCSPAADAINPIVIKGYKFFDSVTKNEFFVKGVAYQPRTSVVDPLAQPTACQRDIPLMQKLGINVIRVYQVDPTLNHDDCMKAFESAGIYLILDLTSPNNSIDRSKPSYDLSLYKALTATVDAFSSYPNTMAFFGGNEVTNNNTNTDASAFVKASIRDIKAYIKATKSRYIPVGYSSNDDADIRDQLDAYFDCGDPTEQVDFYGLNLYEWCGTTVNFQTSGYANRTLTFSTYNIPVILSEYGCNLVTPRVFAEVATIYSSNMTDVWSGGIVYEWTEEANNYGLVQIDQATGQVTTLTDYDNLQKALAGVSPNGVNMDQFSSSRQGQPCPPASSSWRASTKLPPTPSEAVCTCMVSSLSCVSNGQVTMNDSVGKQLGIVCGMTSCADITVDGTQGLYGKYSFCAPIDKLSYVYNAYYVAQKKVPQACQFSGYAQTATPQRQSDQGCTDLTAGRNATTNSTTSATSSTRWRFRGCAVAGASLLSAGVLALG
ncbi:Glucanosyltransferase-domain-containing protein [Jimgerdemannia flammicorona]|uniref:1,3-beta-glucanosyltransferase n=1 Tax=Jimgerdemannia flammicorona TaxID=994334 RepID=A0A433QV60_9FUNG|nr:Glucanosyltransferase-domain-containing protein [Jimgerdemannia flammicorona]